MATEFNAGYGNKGFSDVRSLGEAEDVLNSLNVPYEVCIRQDLSARNFSGLERYQEGVHIYFMNDAKTVDFGYYTPLMNSLIINGKPRKWGMWKNLTQL